VKPHLQGPVTLNAPFGRGTPTRNPFHSETARAPLEPIFKRQPRLLNAKRHAFN